MKPRYLTKSRFKLAVECPTKLFYTSKKGYRDLKQEDSFLQALADGGFQVGEFAKYLFPNGIAIESKDNSEAEALTTASLSQPFASMIYSLGWMFLLSDKIALS